MTETTLFHYRTTIKITVGIAVTFPLTALAESQTTSTHTVIETMVVTATGYEQSTSEAPASISVIDRTQIESRSYKDLTDALKDIPGVVITGGGSRQEISLRGMPSSYTAILVNGRKQSGRETQVSSGGGFEQDWLPPIKSIERIEVVRGPMSTLYGSDAIGGVINIITRKNVSEWTGNLRAEATLQENRHSGNFYQGEMYLAGPLIEGLASTAISGMYQERVEDNILYANGGKTLENYRASLFFTPTEKDTISLDYTHHDQERVNTGGQSRPKSSATNNNRQSVGLAHNANYESVVGSSYISTETVENVGRNLKVQNINANTQWSRAFGEHYVSFGAAFEHEELDNSSFIFKNSQLSLFAENEWYLTDHFALTIGLRYDDNQEYDSHFSPRVYGVWTLSPEWTMKGGVSTGYRTPSLTEMEEDWAQESCNGRCELYGNSDLKPESSVNTELGIYYSDEHNLNTSLTVFYNDFKDKVDTIKQDPSCTGRACDSTYVNVEDAITYGTEASINKGITAAIQLGATYTYTYSEKKSGEDRGQPLTQAPKHLVGVNANWAIRDDIHSWLRVSYRSKESAPITADSQSVSAPSITYLDFGGHWQIHRQFKLMAGIYNLLDTETTYDEYGYVEDGRRYWIAAEASF
ncbi:TonB-dependent receptor domain-containing protein [Vibrio cholerae]|uniref:TonB-dependent receptor domain-containing protein n=1 Tax=Vibrio cholerae TaxID=666 RepID=UPI0028ABF7AD|nr:TonB-dependent receptor [Vibrio cholerae]